jgi:hypothetical protein
MLLGLCGFREPTLDVVVEGADLMPASLEHAHA